MQDENIHIGQLLKQFIRYWKIYVPIGIACLIGGIIFILVTPKEFDINARMQLLGEKGGMMSELKMLKSSGLGGILGSSGGGANTEDEIEVMSSRNNLMEVIRQTDYQIKITTKSGLKQILLDRSESPLLLSFPVDFWDQLSAPIDIELTLENGMIKDGAIQSRLFKTIKIGKVALPYNLVLPVGTIAISPQIKYDGTFTANISPLQKTYEELLKTVNIKPSEATSNILQLSCRAENKQLGCKLINTIMDVYNANAREIKIKEAEVNASFVKDRLDTITNELVLLEQHIEVYKQANKISDPLLYGELTYKGGKEIEKLILETETRLHMLDYVIKYMKDPANAYAAVPMVDGGGEKAIELYNQLVLNRQSLLQSSEINNPVLKLAENQLKEQRKMLLESVESARKGLRISLDEYNKKDNSFNKLLDKLPTQEREYVEMKRQQKIKETIYLFLVQKLQEKKLVNSPDELSGRVIDQAYSSYKHVFPDKAIVLIVAFITACILSLIVISFKVFAFNKK